MKRVVTFLSDFGLSDTYVAEVKGALLTQIPDLTVVDITHLIPPYRIMWGAFQLFDPTVLSTGTIHLGAVDPSVGLLRKLVYVKTKRYHFLGPDNGLLLWAVRDCENQEQETAQVYEIPYPPALSNFQTRDVLVPFIKKIIMHQIPKLPQLTQLQGKEFPGSREIEGHCRGEILGSDQFGNVITSIPIGSVQKAEIQIGHREERIRSVSTYSEIEANKVALIRGSHGFWELSAREKPAWDLLSLEEGLEVTLHPLD